MGTYDYRLLSKSQLGRLDRHLHAALSSWLDRWVAKPIDRLALDLLANERLLNCDLATNDNWQRFTYGKETWLALSWRNRSEMELGRYLAGDLWGIDGANGTSPIASAMLRRAQASLAEFIIDSPRGFQQAEISETDFEVLAGTLHRPGTGYVLANVELGKLSISVILGDGCIDEIAGEPRSVSTATGLSSGDLNSAIVGQPVRLRLDIGEAELSVGELQSLKKGDVICLDQELGAPLPLYIDACKLEVSAHLGLKLRKKAIQLMLLEHNHENSA